MEKNYNRSANTYKIAICYNDKTILVGKKDQIFIYTYDNDLHYAEHIVLNKNLHLEQNLLQKNINSVFSKIDGIPEGYSLIDIKLNINTVFLTFVVNNLKKVFYSFGYHNVQSNNTLGRYNYEKPEISSPKINITDIAPLLIYRSRGGNALKILEVLNTSNDDCYTTLLLTNVGLVLIGLNPRDNFFGCEKWQSKVDSSNLLYVDGIIDPPPIILKHPDLNKKIKKTTLNAMHILCLMKNGDLYGCGANFNAMGFTSFKVRTMFEKIDLPVDYTGNKIIDIESTDDYSFLLIDNGNIICFIGKRVEELVGLLVLQQNIHNLDNAIVEQKYRVISVIVDNKKVNENITKIMVNHAYENKNILVAITEKNRVFSVKEFFSDKTEVIDFLELKHKNTNILDGYFKIIDVALSISRMFILVLDRQGKNHIICYDEENVLNKLPFPLEIKQDFFSAYPRFNNINNLNLYKYYENCWLLSSKGIINTDDVQYHHLPSSNFFRINNDSKLIVAIKHKSLKELHKICEKLKEDELNYLINQVNYEGNTPILIAAKIEDVCQITNSMITHLILFGANLDVFDNDGNHLLHLAVQHGYLDLVKKIIKLYPSKINVLNNQHQTPLFIAVLNEDYYLKGLEYAWNILIDAGANVDLIDISKTHLIHILAKKDYLNLLKIAISKLSFKSIWRQDPEGKNFLNLLLKIKDKNYYDSTLLNYKKSLLKEIILELLEITLSIDSKNIMHYLQEILYFSCHLELIEVVEKILLINPDLLCYSKINNENFLVKIEYDLNSNVNFSFKILEFIVENLDFNKNNIKTSLSIALLQYFIINQEEYNILDTTLAKLLEQISLDILEGNILPLIFGCKNNSSSLEMLNPIISNKIIIHCVNMKNYLSQPVINKIFLYSLQQELFDTAINMLNNLNNEQLMLTEKEVKDVALLAINNNVSLSVINKLLTENIRFKIIKENIEELIVSFLKSYIKFKIKLEKNDEKFLILLINNALELDFNLDSKRLEHVIFDDLTIKEYFLLIAINHEYNEVLSKLLIVPRLRFLEVFCLNELNKTNYFVTEQVFTKIIDSVFQHIVDIETLFQGKVFFSYRKVENILISQFLLLTATYIGSMNIVNKLLALNVELTFNMGKLPLVLLIAKYNLDKTTIILRELIEFSLHKNIEVYDKFIQASLSCNLFSHYLEYGYKKPEIYNKNVFDFNHELKLDQWCLLYAIKFNIRTEDLIEKFFNINVSLITEANIPLLFIMIENNMKTPEVVLDKLIEKSIKQGINLRNDFNIFSNKLFLIEDAKFIKHLLLISIKQDYKLLVEKILFNYNINWELFEHKENFDYLLKILNDLPYYFKKYEKNTKKINKSLTLEFFIEFSVNKIDLNPKLVENLLISLINEYEDLDVIVKLLNNFNIIANLNKLILTKLLKSIFKQDEFKKLLAIPSYPVFVDKKHNSLLPILLQKIINLNSDFNNNIDEISYKNLLFFSVNNLYLEILKQLLNLNLNININFFLPNNETLLYRSIMNWYYDKNILDSIANSNNIEIITLLIDYGAKIHPLDHDFKRTISFACQYNCDFIVNKLLDNLAINNSNNQLFLYDYNKTNKENFQDQEASSSSNRNFATDNLSSDNQVITINPFLQYKF